MNELSGASETTTATGSEDSGGRETTDSSGRHAAARDGFQSEDDALEALLASEDRALEKSLGKEDRAVEAFLAEEDGALEALLAEEDRDLEAFLAAEDQLLEPSQCQQAPGGTGGDNPGPADEAGLGAEPDGGPRTLAADGQAPRDGEDHAQGKPPGEAGGGDGSGGEAADTLDQGAGESPAQPPLIHGWAKVRGMELDLWRDGEGHWAGDYKRADDALPVDHLADVRSRMGPEAMPVTEWADGHAIEVTRNPKDGVWIPGMPGDVPDEAGDVLAGADTPEEPRSRSRDFAGELVRNAERGFDEVNEVSDVGYKVLHHPPEGKAEVPVPAHGPVVESTPHETPIGGMMTGVLAATIGLWVLRENFHEWRTSRKAGAGHASDG